MPRPEPGSTRDLIALILGYGLIVSILRIPAYPQRIHSPVALIVTLAIVLARRPSLDDLGLSRRGLVRSLWILPAAVVLAVVSVLVARQIGTLHALYQNDIKHAAGYVLWTLYQQFLLNDLFMPRLTRPLTAATLVWGAISCALFRRHHNLYALGLAQGLLGLCFAICVPDALHHHLRVGLGYLRYHDTPPLP